MAQAIDDFTIILAELTDVVAGELKIYHGLDQLWRMVEHYRMTAPITIRVIDNKTRCVRTIRGNHHATTGWQLADDTPSVELALGDEGEFPDDKHARCQRKHIENEAAARRKLKAIWSELRFGFLSSLVFVLHDPRSDRQSP